MNVCLLVDTESSIGFHHSIERLIEGEDDVPVNLIILKKLMEANGSWVPSDESLLRKHVYMKLNEKVFLNPTEKSPVTPDQFDSQPEVIDVEPERVGEQIGTLK